VDAVFHSHGAQVWRAVLAMSAGRAEVADDAAAEAFARLYAYRAGVRDPVAWVFRTAFRVAAVELGRERSIAPEAAPAVESHDRGLLTPALTSALMELSPDQRAAVFLHHVADLPVREVARLTDAPVATVKVRLHRARRALRTSLDLIGELDG
jgi:RNA polymerase sigma-70 factor (ECF subfamily)